MTCEPEMHKRDIGCTKIHLYPPSSAGSVPTSTCTTTCITNRHLTGAYPTISEWMNTFRFFFWFWHSPSLSKVVYCTLYYYICILKLCTLIDEDEDEAYARYAWAMERWSDDGVLFPLQSWGSVLVLSGHYYYA